MAYLDYRDCAPPILEEFLLNEAINRRSSKTIQEYFLDIQMFLRYIKMDRGGMHRGQDFNDISIMDVDERFLAGITEQDVEMFKLYLSNERYATPKSRAPGLTPAAVNRKLCALRTFFKYLVVKKHLLGGKNPMQGVESLKANRKPPESLTVEESRRILNAVSGLNETRDYAIILVALVCGLRVGEIAGLNVEDIRYSDPPHLAVFGKGGKHRNIPVPPICMEALEHYLTIREDTYQPTEQDAPALFLSRFHKRISVDAVQVMVRNVFLKAELNRVYPHASPHLFRHTAATTMLRGREDGTGKQDIRIIQEFLGHASISTTQIYTKVYNEDVQSAVFQSPLAELEKKEK